MNKNKCKLFKAVVGRSGELSQLFSTYLWGMFAGKILELIPGIDG
jgi:hypothetical protein